MRPKGGLRRWRLALRTDQPQYAASPLGQAAAFDGKLWFDAGKAANFDYRDRVHDFKDRFAISAWFYPESENSGAIVTRMSDNVTEQENNLPKGRGYGVFFVNGKVHFNLVGVWADDSFRVETENTLPVKQWHHVLAVFDSLQPYEKVKIYLDGQKQTLKVNNGRLFRQFANAGAHLRIGGRRRIGSGTSMGCWTKCESTKRCRAQSRLRFWPVLIRFPGLPRSLRRCALRGSG